MKKQFNRFLLPYFVNLLFYFNICLSLIYTVNYFYVFPVICYIKNTSRCKISIVPEEGWFGQPKYSTPSKTHSTSCRFLPLYSSFNRFLIAEQGRDGGAVRVLASHQSGPGPILVRCHMWVEFVVGSRRGFFSGFSGFPPSTKTNTPIRPG